MRKIVWKNSQTIIIWWSRHFQPIRPVCVCRKLYISFSHLNSIWFVFYVRNALFFAVSLVWKLCIFRNCLTFSPSQNSWVETFGIKVILVMLIMLYYFTCRPLFEFLNSKQSYKRYPQDISYIPEHDDYDVFFCVFHSLLVPLLQLIS